MGLEVNQHTFHECEGCGVVTAHPKTPFLKADFSNYGEYLIKNAKEIEERVAYEEKVHRKFFNEVCYRYGRTARILDYGAGAGYFLKAAKNYGFSTSGYEISNKLIDFAKIYLGITLTNKKEDLFNDYDVICMFDVIEHIPVDVSKLTMDQLMSRLIHGGMLYGNTPNYRSLNIIIFGNRDPVIAPPSHACYFTVKSLDLFLASFKLNKISLLTKGLSSNSFFRKEKFTPSFLEKSAKSIVAKWTLQIPLKALFKIFGNILSATNHGYQIIFKYEKE